MADPQFAYPFYPVQFTIEGVPFQTSEATALLAALAADPLPTDLVIISHGWNNNIDDAKSLYSGLVAQLADQVAKLPALKGRSFLTCGILWPSKKFEDTDLIPSGAASLNDSVQEPQLINRVNDLSNLLQGKGWAGEKQDATVQANLASVLSSVSSWSDDPGVRSNVVELIRQLVPATAADTEDASSLFFKLKPESLITNLSRSLNPPAITPGANAASLDPFRVSSQGGLGGAASFRDVLGGLNAALMHYLNYVTYYIMKARAGDVGVKGVEPLMEKVRAARPDIRIHLIGHSFGCRVVASALNALPAGDAVRPNTVTLLQGAFSHNGFASKFDGSTDGGFRQVLVQKKVRGPILITHTHNDTAVGVAYPIASRLAGHVASALGDENDIYGGLGSNGAQNADTTPERVTGTLLDVGGSYPFAAGSTSSKPYNLLADRFIHEHSDIVHPEIAYAQATAMASPDAQ